MDAIAEFASLLIREVRDQTVQQMDVGFQNRGVLGQHWRGVVATMSAQEAVLALMPDVVDATLARLFDAIDEGVLPLLYRSEKGDLVDLHEAGKGEMSGYYADDAWLRDFSRERYRRSTWTPMCSLRLRFFLPRAAYDVNQADWTVFSTVTRGAQSRQRSQTRAGIPQGAATKIAPPRSRRDRSRLTRLGRPTVAILRPVPPAPLADRGNPA